MAGLILVVEDDLDLQEMYREILIHHGYLVETASNGEEGVTKYKKKKPNLVLMDSDMPKMNGYESFLKIKEFDNNANVVMITGYSERDKRLEESSKLGLKSIITKPVGMDDILELAKKFAK